MNMILKRKGKYDIPLIAAPSVLPHRLFLKIQTFFLECATLANKSIETVTRAKKIWNSTKMSSPLEKITSFQEGKSLKLV